MFESKLPDPADVRRLGDAALAAAITESARVAAAAEARTAVAVAELVRRRVVDEHPDWSCDDWDACAAEVACALSVSHGRASGLMDDAITLRDRLPTVGAHYLAGHLSERAVSTICNRTGLVTDAAALTAIDADIADSASRFGPLSKYKLEKAVDAIVERRDPGAVRRSRNSLQGRDFTIGDPCDPSGTVSVSGRLSAADGALLHQAVGSLIHSVCDDDPRTLAQRRSDAMGALAVRATRLPCRCDNPDCPAAAGEDEVAARFVVHILADASALSDEPDGDPGDDDPTGPTRPGPTPPPDDDGPHGPATPTPPATPEPTSAPPSPPPPASDDGPAPRPAAVVVDLPRGGVLPATLLADLIARGAAVRWLTTPGPAPASSYRLPADHSRFVRYRDLTCRFPGCDRPATTADIDHSIPWPVGATHPSNTNCKCRKHHLLKTFWPGWSERQDPDGTVTVTTPSGVTYATKPFAALLFPSFDPSSAPLPAVTATPSSPSRGLAMPKRRRPRVKARAARIRAERALNADRVAERNIAPPF
ncbi:MAG: DUF222 domain-containing protein [Mycobacterium sp.]